MPLSLFQWAWFVFFTVGSLGGWMGIALILYFRQSRQAV